MQTLAWHIDRTAAARGDAVALCWGDVRLSFEALGRQAQRVRVGLKARGIGPGDRVAVGLVNSPELIASVLGVLSAGAVLVPLNPAYTTDEAAYIVGDSEARVVVTHVEQAEGLRQRRLAGVEWIGSGVEAASGGVEIAEGAGDDPALIVYTSGTTGRPKGAVLSNRALLSNLAAVANAWQWTASDRLLLTLPCFHLHGLALGVLGSLLVGSQIVLRPRFVADEVLAEIARNGITLFFGVPTMYNRLVALPEDGSQGSDLSSMRLWVSGSAPLTPTTFERFERRFGQRILERFGMSEGGFMIAVPYEGPRRPGVVGKAVPGVDVRIVDSDLADAGRLSDVPDGEQGELVMRGANLFSGYWKRPVETARAHVEGYFRSGDLAVREDDGMIRITGRSSVDIIKTRGFKVGAVEIENELQAHPAVRDVAVVGMPDPDQGERVVAVVTLRPDLSVTADELRSFAREHLAPHKVPAEIRFVEEIPSTGPGKFSKKRLVALLGEGADHLPLDRG